jgi:hypothetical protein
MELRAHFDGMGSWLNEKRVVAIDYRQARVAVANSRILKGCPHLQVPPKPKAQPA